MFVCLFSQSHKNEWNDRVEFLHEWLENLVKTIDYINVTTYIRHTNGFDIFHRFKMASSIVTSLFHSLKGFILLIQFNV